MANLTPVDHDPFAAAPAQQAVPPALTDDGSDWSKAASSSNLTPVDNDPFAQAAPADKGKPVWSSSALSLAPMSQYGDGSYGFDSNAGMLGAAKRAGQSVLSTVENLPNLYSQVGSETANNTATPGTAGGVANLAALTAMGPDVKTVTRPTIPAATSPAIHAAADADFDTLRNMNVHYEPDAAAAAMQAQQDALSKRGWSSETATKTHSILSKLSNPPEGAGVSTPLTGFMEARAQLGKVGQGADAQDAAAAKNSIRAIDQFIANPTPQSVMAGPAADASTILQRANGNYAAAMRSDKVTGSGDYALFRAGRANSGANFDNSLRQQISPLFDPRFTTRRLSGFNPDEKAALSQVVQGSPLRNGLRAASSYMGGGGGGVAALEGMEAARTGNELAGPLGAAVGATVPFVGRGIRAAQNGMARSSLNNVDDLVRSRAPLSQEMQATAPLAQTPATNSGISAAKAIAAHQQPSIDPDQSQPQYAKGGAVKKPIHEFLVNRLMKLAEKAKREEKKITAPILNMPDDAVTTALAKAQEAI